MHNCWLEECCTLPCKAQEAGAVNLKRIRTLFWPAQRRMVPSGIIPNAQIFALLPEFCLAVMLDLLYGMFSDVYTMAELRQIVVSNPFDRSEHPRQLKLVELTDWLEALVA